ncbi:MAG: SOUL family heme-binding protein [Vampirovibrionales bacterium]
MLTFLSTLSPSTPFFVRCAIGTALVVTGVLTMMMFSQAHAGKYAEAQYQVVETIDSQCEIRRYEPMALLATSTLLASSASGSSNMNKAFGYLFAYIQGANSTKSKIAMTVPVLQYIHPALHPGDDTRQAHQHMAFILPKPYTAKNAPKPLQEGVIIVDRPTQTFAVCQFSGSSRDTVMAKHAEHLTKVMQREGLKPTHADMSPMYAYYNAPFTLPFLKRNEVWVRIEPKV